MRPYRAAIAIAAWLTIGCATGAREPERDSQGLVRVHTWRKAGNLFAHESQAIDDYDDIWLAEVGIQYDEAQERLAETDEARVRKMVYDAALNEVPAAGQLAAREAGPCTLKMGVYLVKLSLAPRAP